MLMSLLRDTSRELNEAELRQLAQLMPDLFKNKTTPKFTDVYESLVMSAVGGAGSGGSALSDSRKVGTSPADSPPERNTEKTILPSQEEEKKSSSDA